MRIRTWCWSAPIKNNDDISNIPRLNRHDKTQNTASALHRQLQCNACVCLRQRWWIARLNEDALGEVAVTFQPHHRRCLYSLPCTKLAWRMSVGAILAVSTVGKMPARKCFQINSYSSHSDLAKPTVKLSKKIVEKIIQVKTMNRPWYSFQTVNLRNFYYSVLILEAHEYLLASNIRMIIRTLVAIFTLWPKSTFFLRFINFIKVHLADY